MRLRTIQRYISSYFTEPTGQKYLFYLACLCYVIVTSIIVIVEPYIDIPCEEDTTQSSELEFGNSLYVYSKCNSIKQAKLLYFSRVDCLRGRHLLMAVFLGALIGYERRESDRPAGIRTMSLVSLGSALFTINSTFGFVSGPMGWDASRVSAAIPSGVGFLGAGLIVKTSEVDPTTGERHHLVQGITTAGAIWMSAAVGLACGGGLYFVASFAVALNLVLLRFGPRPTSSSDDSSTAGSYGSMIGRDVIATNKHGKAVDIETGRSPGKQTYGSTAQESEPLQKDEALEPLKRTDSTRMRKKKVRPSLL
mmetsp:Transcript_19631/g.39330  ORF Transcript_19631/g.39330 Transcript_19631/m.39330 type:complete len:308 (+) Transcript_19631:68-991(+)